MGTTHRNWLESILIDLLSYAWTGLVKHIFPFQFYRWEACDRKAKLSTQTQTMYAVLGTSHTLVTLLLVHFITELLYSMEGIGYEEVCQTFLLNPKVFLLCAESLTLSLGRTGYNCVIEFCMRLLLLCCLWKCLPAFWLIKIILGFPWHCLFWGLKLVELWACRGGWGNVFSNRKKNQIKRTKQNALMLFSW